MRPPTPPRKAKQPRVMVTLGIPLEDVELIHQACEAVGESRHHFIRSAAVERASAVLERATTAASAA